MSKKYLYCYIKETKMKEKHRDTVKNIYILGWMLLRVCTSERVRFNEPA